MNTVDARIEALEAQLVELRAELTTTRNGGGEAGAVESSRRDVFKKAAIATAGVATVGILGRSTTAHAVDGGNVVIGDETQTAQSPTALIRSAGFTGSHVLFIDDSSGFNVGASFAPGAIAGWSGSRSGVYGFTANGPAGIVASTGGDNSVGLLAAGASRANVWLLASGAPPLSRAVDHVSGELVEDGNDDLWLCVADGNPGTWRKLGGPATAGQLHLLGAPVRIYDSRPTEAPLTVPPKSPLDPATPRTIDATLNSSGVPATATGLLVNATATGGAGPGFLTLWPEGPWPGTSSVNWSAASLTVAATTVTRCGPNATFQVQSNVAVDVLFDVIGYYQ